MSVSTSTVKDTLSKTRHADAPVHPEADEARTSAARKRSAQLARARGTGNLLAMLLPLLLALVLLVSWYVSTANGLVNSLFLPTPADVFASLSDGIVSGMYLSNTLVTMQESV